VECIVIVVRARAMTAVTAVSPVPTTMYTWLCLGHDSDAA